jgi:hypothetical protein
MRHSPTYWRPGTTPGQVKSKPTADSRITVGATRATSTGDYRTTSLLQVTNKEVTLWEPTQFTDDTYGGLGGSYGAIRFGYGGILL